MYFYSKYISHNFQSVHRIQTKFSNSVCAEFKYKLENSLSPTILKRKEMKDLCTNKILF
jgi:hypothetical protein